MLCIGKSPEDALYIRNETRLLFHKNRDLQDKAVIKEKLFEAQSRYELALHYGIPQPRYYNVSPKTHNATVGKKRAKAAYLDSYYEDSSNTT